MTVWVPEKLKNLGHDELECWCFTGVEKRIRTCVKLLHVVIGYLANDMWKIGFFHLLIMGVLINYHED